MPNWVLLGFNDYAKRLPSNFKLQLVEIPLVSRVKTMDLQHVLHKEGQRMLQAISPDDFVIALDERGIRWSTKILASKLSNWQENYKVLSFLIGGPDGLAPACLSRATLKWSLSDLTLPHPLVRIIVAEQIYRAWSILQKHPYHRG